MKPQPEMNSVTFERKSDLIPVETVHVSVHLNIYIRPEFKPKAGEQEAFHGMVSKIGDVIREFEQEIKAIHSDRPLEQSEES